MQKEMTRKEFLATMALALGSLMGFSTIIHLLTGKSLSHQAGRSSAVSYNYGGGPYGGPKTGKRVTSA